MSWSWSLDLPFLTVSGPCPCSQSHTLAKVRVPGFTFIGLARSLDSQRQIPLPVLSLHCKKELAVFPSPAGMSLIKLFLGGNNLVLSRPERVWAVTSRLGTGKWLTLFYSVDLPFLILPCPGPQGSRVYITPRS
jgi:hypothetical protein